MVQFTDALVLALLAATTRAAPLSLNKRIAQTTIDSVTPWEDACNSAGGGSQCNPIAVTAASTLLAAAGNCDQQNSADAMITLAKTLNNNADMISLAQIFAQQPRNSPNSLAVPYCETAPQNSELNGFFQCQFQGSDQTSFVGGLSVGDAGTIPFGLSAAVNPAGSCPANPSGPVADGQQLNTITQNPGTPSSSGSTASGSTGSTASSASVAPAAASSAASSSASTSDNDGSGAAVGASASSTSTAGTTTSSSTSTSSGFALSNGQAAQALNAQFATLTASSTCTDGQNACVNGAFAQCVGGKFETTQCAGGTTCAALPLVNSAGTSITCTTTADAEARIAATGATGGITGDGSTAAASSAGSDTSATDSAAVSTSTAAASTNQAATSSSSTSSFALSNGQAAQKLNAQFATLTASSSCTEGQNACVNGAFAQCVNGSFETTQCAGGTTCAALPLVNSAGTSITCATTADAEARIAATGATGGLTGSS
ncbi:uncharacterized protein C8R40DRAFT_1037481 [Lentinula edodes]|uniref:uncharacterized protein n=1 Tax=Lentinula edodes TaxID=5353 RepID=UPI001E8D1B09|nr:uncharacterized protein C8R40DRAFT_1037481 [Lentinula edodes]KAH7878925.1 hypothetical protein C8R40DRAFT_1037481 [Lentinula edodes]